MKIEGVIFDLDGTLIHTIDDIAAGANRMLSGRGKPSHPVERYLEWIGSGALKLIERAYGSEVEREELIGMVKEFKYFYGQNLHDKSRVYDGIDAVLDRITERGIPMAILSNKPHELTLEVVEYYLSHWAFTHVFGQREEVPRKPDPEAAFEIAEGMGVDPDKILFVGDSNNDILTAQAAGMIPLGVFWGYGRLRQEAVPGDYRILEKVDELLEIL
jgi:phosphoglycolate phosphatase